MCQSSPRVKVIVMGAGMAGLVAAFELCRAGLDPIVLEARNRVGGRIYTIRSFAPGLYGEAGAMRIPRAHKRTLKYCAHFGLKLRDFTSDDDNTIVYVRGTRLTARQAEQEPQRLPFTLSEAEQGSTYHALWERSISHLRDQMRHDGDAWSKIVEEYDGYSLREFLSRRCGFSDGAIEMFGVMNFSEADLNESVLLELHESLHRVYNDLVEIEGGLDLLPRAFYRELQPHIRFGAEIVGIGQTDASVTVQYRTLGTPWRESLDTQQEIADYAICTLPFSVLRYVHIDTPFSQGKQRAIRQLHYSPATKILMQFKRSFWRDENINGGTTITDLPIRRVIYPRFNPADQERERSVLTVSYTWSHDAVLWGAMDPEARLVRALKDLTHIHPHATHEFEIGASHAWQLDRFSGGAYAMFQPGQASLRRSIRAPEHRIHFAGEHTSEHQAWIEGAVESGQRAAEEILTAVSSQA